MEMTTNKIRNHLGYCETHLIGLSYSIGFASEHHLIPHEQKYYQ